MKNRIETRSGSYEAISNCWCIKARKRFGLVFVRSTDNVWEVKHSYTVSEDYAEKEGGEQAMKGAFSIAPAYNGCKWCGDKSIFQCSACSELNCQGNQWTSTFRCANCGNTGVLSGAIRSVSSSND